MLEQPHTIFKQTFRHSALHGESIIHKILVALRIKKQWKPDKKKIERLLREAEIKYAVASPPPL